MSNGEKLAVAQKAIAHVLDAIASDPRKFWLLGDGTGSYEQLTTALAALWEKPVELVRESHRPEKERYERYCREREANEKLLERWREPELLFLGKFVPSYEAERRAA